MEGRVVKGYELRERIGDPSGMGVVYRAEQPLLRREVAVKIILPQYANNPDFIRRFEIEAQLVARLAHPHIVPLFDYWRESDGAYLVMRYLPGGSLRAALRNESWNDEATGRLLDQIAGALAVAHRNKVIHRDLKPDNILLDEDRNAYLVDFGIAKDLQVDTDTQSQNFMTPYYAAPEQFIGDPLTPQTDIYSLGVMLYELLTGSHPFAGLTLTELISKTLSEPLPPLHTHRAGLPDALNNVIQRATAKQPTARYGSVLEIAEEFHRAFGGQAPRQAASTVEFMDFTDVANPYKGLRAFQEHDAADFFGRGTLTERLLKRLGEASQTARFLAVVGPSGSGKSSVVNAGLLPALRTGALPGSDQWFIVEMFPGAYPLVELEAALLRIAVNPPPSLIEQLERDDQGLLRAIKRVLPADEKTELLLFIDQFEELFTLAEDERVRTHFIDNLLAALNEPRSRLRVIVTLRADFYDKPLLYTEFGELVRQRTEVVLPLTPQELEQAIVSPAQQIGAVFEPGLVDTIVKEVGEQPGTLPLLQYALTELFEQRKGQRLTRAAYRDIGGVTGALAKRAEDLFTQLDEKEQDASRQLFLRLVTLGEGVEDTRRRVKRSELTADVSMDQVIDSFGKARLLTFDRDPVTRGPTLEVAHEALLRTWSRLRGWLADSRDDLRLHRKLTQAAAEWEQAGRDPSFVLTGTRLEQYESWVNQTTLALNAVERAYLQASIVGRTQRQQLEDARKAREAELELRSQTRLRYLVAVLLIATLIAFGLSGLAFNQSQIAQSNAATATLAQGQAINNAATSDHNAATAVAAQATSNANVTTAFNEQGTAQKEANRANANAATSDANALTAVAAQSTATYSQGEALHSADDARTQAARADNNASTAVAAQGTAQKEANRANANAATSDANALTAVAAQSTASYSQGEALHSADDARTQAARADNNASTAVAAQDDALNQAATSRANVATAVAAQATAQRSFKEAQSLALSGGSLDALNLAQPDIAVALALEANAIPNPPSEARRALANAAAYSWIVRRYEGHSAAALSVAFSPDGHYAVSGSDDTSLILWNVTTGAIIRRFEGHTDWVYSVAFSPDGRYILSGSKDKSVILWDVATGNIVHRFEGHTDWVRSVAFSPDGRYIVSGSKDMTLILWEVTTGDLVYRWNYTAPIFAVAFSPDGQSILLGLGDNLLALWDVAKRDIVRRFQQHTDIIYGIAISRDGRYALSASYDSTVILWDMAKGNMVRRFLGHTSGVMSVAFSPDGRFMLSSSLDGTVRLWEVATGETIRMLQGHTDSVGSVIFSPDGRYALSAGNDHAVILWDVTTTDQLRRFQGHTDAVRSIAFSPDGRYALSGSQDKSLILWDVATGSVLRRFQGHTDAVSSVAFSPDGRTAVSGSFDKTVILWDIGTGNLVRRFQGHSNAVWAVAFSPDGRYVVSGSADDTLILWDVVTGNSVRQIQTNYIVSSVAFSPNGRYILSGSVDDTLTLWDAATGDMVRPFEGHTGQVTSIVFSPDGRYALSGSYDSTAILWDVATGAIERRFQGHTDKVQGVALSSDGRYALSSAFNDGLILWDVATGDILRRFYRYSNQTSVVAFSPDGHTALSALSDSTLMLWDISPYPGGLLAWAQANRYAPELSCEQRATYRVDLLCNNQQTFPTRTPYPTPVPTMTFTPSPTVDFIRTTATPTSTPYPSPTATLSIEQQLPFTPFPVTTIPGYTLDDTRLISDPDEIYRDNRMLLAPGDIALSQDLTGNQGEDLNIIQSASPFATLQIWATAAGVSNLNTLMIANVEVARFIGHTNSGKEVRLDVFIYNGIYVSIRSDPPIDEATLETIITQMVGASP